MGIKNQGIKDPKLGEKKKQKIYKNGIKNKFYLILEYKHKRTRVLPLIVITPDNVIFLSPQMSNNDGVPLYIILFNTLLYLFCLYINIKILKFS